MSPSKSPLATVRIDRGAVHVSARRWVHPRSERHAVSIDASPGEALQHAFAASSLLRPGRALRTLVLLESPQVTFSPTSGPSAEKAWSITLPSGVREGLLAALGRRHVRGPATLEFGPLARADASLAFHPNLPVDDVGIVVDRSSAAVTVLVISSFGLAWARSVPAEDPALAARLLIDRACGLIPRGASIRWWRLHDVATTDDARSGQRQRREFEAAAAVELEGVPLLQEVGA